MGRFTNDKVYDEGFDGVIANVNKIVACSQQPTNFTEANSTFKLAEAAIASGDLTKGAGSPDGRRVTVAAKTLTGTANGTADHVALIDTTNSVLYVVTPCTSVGITNGNTQDFKTWWFQFRAPTAP